MARQAKVTCRSWSTSLVALALWALPVGGMAAPGPGAPAGVTISYDAPSNPAHTGLRDLVQEKRVLEKARGFFVPFRLPRPLLLRTAGCDGDINAWFEDDVITICYEYLQDIRDTAANAKRPDWVSESAAIIGPVIDVFLHEGAHAIFDYFKVPVLGREEDAADLVSAYALLRLFGPEAQVLIPGIVYYYLSETGEHTFRTLERKRFHVVGGHAQANVHSNPLQRMYNVMCLAYGADPVRFRNVVALGVLPKDRAEGCADEYAQTAHAFDTLIRPHIDLDVLAREFPQEAAK